MFEQIYEKCKNLEFEKIKLKEELEAAEEKIEKFRDQNFDLSQEMFNLQVQLSMNKSDIQYYKKALETLKHSNHQKEISDLKEQVEKAKKSFYKLKKFEEDLNNSISNSNELIATLEQKCEEQEKLIKDLKSEISNTRSEAESRHKAFRRASEHGWELEAKLKKIPKWIQKIFIK